MSVSLEPSWLAVLKEEFDKPYMLKLKSFLVEEKAQKHTVYPKNADIFNAFEHTPFNKVKVVILGQDPYHGAGQAHGLSFSVQKGVAIPPSLQNIYKELAKEYKDFTIPTSGDLTYWADQGVLLLNATLTVRANTPGSHQKKGWEIFTDEVIKKLSEEKEGIVFILWGKYAQAKTALIDEEKHFVLKAAHPSPYAAMNGFFDCNHFIETNKILEKQGLKTIDWQI